MNAIIPLLKPRYEKLFINNLLIVVKINIHFLVFKKYIRTRIE
ncbi:Hypothetical protein IALB_2229 [Ignavibacterium album JCM 16511]|uniref:Uncharacterized protein n=1 Tax=Ignavibacterium album (strain DSM 19864 / JCM 16511 / NBRC 101810 / Mat9-16) TaxID=945713 RepID=I0ALS5_IGNAJ|nr:Hypothetical protein IALB_2229 [Ignavibacterium album JCM 16511]